MKILNVKSLAILSIIAIFLMLFVSACSDKKTTPQIGDMIPFGAYQWRVLDIQGGRALLISQNILEQRAYNTSPVDITWENCSLRAYLNGDFYNTFSVADRNRIVQVTNVNANNQWFGTHGGANTQDRIFLLSLAEVVQYFGDSGQLSNRPPYAEYISDQYNSNRMATLDGWAFWFWLRSPGFYSYRASNVFGSGGIGVDGGDVDLFNGGVRPALWLNL